MEQPKEYKDLRATLLGYARPSSIKRTRKRQIERARLSAMSLYGRRRYKTMKAISKAFYAYGISAKNV